MTRQIISGTDRFCCHNVIDSPEPFHRELLKRQAVIEHDIHAFYSECAQSARELLQAFVVIGELCHAGIGEIMASTELKAYGVLALSRYLDERILADAQGSAITLERDLCNGVEARKKGIDHQRKIRLPVEGQMVAALPSKIGKKKK